MNELFLGNCLDILPTLPQKSVSLVLTDPPYNISAKGTVINRSSLRNKRYRRTKNVSTDFGEWDKFDSEEDFLSFIYQWLDSLIPVLKDDCVFISYFSRSTINFLEKYMIEKHGFKVRNVVIDIKTNPVPRLRKVNWNSSWEIAIIMSKGKNTFNYQHGIRNDHFIRNVVGGKERLKDCNGNTLHPTQKSLEVALTFVKFWSNENDIVLDPFMGSGTFCAAAKALNRQYIGIEINEKFYTAVKKRLRNTKVLPVVDRQMKDSDISDFFKDESK